MDRDNSILHQRHILNVLWAVTKPKNKSIFLMVLSSIPEYTGIIDYTNLDSRRNWRVCWYIWESKLSTISLKRNRHVDFIHWEGETEEHLIFPFSSYYEISSRYFSQQDIAEPLTTHFASEVDNYVTILCPRCSATDLLDCICGLRVFFFYGFRYYAYV